MDTTDQTEDQEPLSKTQRKAAMHALQELGETLLTLNESKLAQLNLPDFLLAAIREGQRINAHGALARQKQYIGKLMREIDTAPIVEQLELWRNDSKQQNLRFHRLEKLRDQLLEDDHALTKLLDEYPAADRQHLRNLVRNARKEAAAGKPPKSQRELFRALRALAENSKA